MFFGGLEQEEEKERERERERVSEKKENKENKENKEKSPNSKRKKFPFPLQNKQQTHVFFTESMIFFV